MLGHELVQRVVLKRVEVEALTGVVKAEPVTVLTAVAG
jgi:hypothetical protein